MYDPHIVPVVDRWQARYTARKRERRGLAPVQVNGNGKGNDPTSAGTELQSLGRNRDADEAEERKSTELENMVTKEVDEWRSAVDRSQSGLRHRTNAGTSGGALEEVNFNIMKPLKCLLNYRSTIIVESIPSIHSDISDTHNIRFFK